MIITDGIHVTSTESLDELHQWAKDNGIKRHWFHGYRKGHPHYDLPKGWQANIQYMRPRISFRTSREILEASKVLIYIEDVT
jgi:hypothetical protein